nr:hypothetical protein [Nocardioides convexus]
MSGKQELTKTGRRLARLPIDPRLGRMLLEAEQAGLRARRAGHRGRPLAAGPARAARRRAAQGARPRRPACMPASRPRARTSSPCST